ncbi:restriction endonuclease subunit S [Chryseobacterium sp. Bi04]|uniref:restriction endonuclease subunit S n=1 Tax=Chryseobacterium sp. Bi04 TaxID=2822345 RepID=UPI001DB00736|nr:restriction endonuclease subunit S [Chryseobacterium sp. Bi04]CAH0290886.1 Type-1 restriction enzyme EcoKI specificity protein [Chryseobacterium sp. Bi04]
MREDWIECTFDDILEIKNGKNQKHVENSNGSYPIYGSSGIIGKASEFLCPENTIIIGRKGTINSPIYVTTKFWNVDTAFGLIPFDNLNPKLLYYFCQFFNFHSLDKSTTIPSLAKGDLLKIIFPLPPIPEQRAIVKKIETLFSSLDASIADLKNSQKQLKIYRQAVLKKAFEGKYKVIKVGDFFNFLGGGTPSKKEKSFWNGNLNWASIKDIKGDFLNSTQDFITEKGLENSSSNIANKGEVILATRINPGRSIISNIKTAINQDLKVIKPKNNCDNHFIHYLFKSIEDKCLKASSGTTVLGISLPNLKDIQIPEILDLKQQQQIVKEIESRLSVCDAVEKQIKNSLDQAEALRQSILKKTFEGSLLTKEELKACKSEPNYEPASVLLERIKVEKEAHKSVKKISKNKVSLIRD